MRELRRAVNQAVVDPPPWAARWPAATPAWQVGARRGPLPIL
jgi:hypothetical protein